MNDNDFLNRLENKVDKLDERLDNIDKTLLRQAGSLEIHIQRTNLAEKRLEHVENTLLPIQTHVVRIQGVIKFFGYVSATTFFLYTLLEIIKAL